MRLEGCWWPSSLTSRSGLCFWGACQIRRRERRMPAKKGGLARAGEDARRIGGDLASVRGRSTVGPCLSAAGWPPTRQARRAARAGTPADSAGGGLGSAEAPAKLATGPPSRLVTALNRRGAEERASFGRDVDELPPRRRTMGVGWMALASKEAVRAASWIGVCCPRL